MKQEVRTKAVEYNVYIAKDGKELEKNLILKMNAYIMK